MFTETIKCRDPNTAVTPELFTSILNEKADRLFTYRPIIQQSMLLCVWTRHMVDPHLFYKSLSKHGSVYLCTLFESIAEYATITVYIVHIGKARKWRVCYQAYFLSWHFCVLAKIWIHIWGPTYAGKWLHLDQNYGGCVCNTIQDQKGSPYGPYGISLSKSAGFREWAGNLTLHVLMKDFLVQILHKQEIDLVIYITRQGHEKDKRK